MSGEESQSDTIRERGVERQEDGRKIPYIRMVHQVQNYVWTCYGIEGACDPRDASRLMRHDRRGATSWGLQVDEMEMSRGEASKALQGAWGKPETTWLYSAVESVWHMPEQLEDYHTPYTAGSIIRDSIRRAIESGNPHGVYLLAKCIETVARTIPKDPKDYAAYLVGGTNRRKVAHAISDAAERFGRIPTWQEALGEFCKVDGDSDEGNFIRALCNAGFRWILPRSCMKS
jgi:hypothetical protein